MKNYGNFRVFQAVRFPKRQDGSVIFRKGGEDFIYQLTVFQLIGGYFSGGKEGVDPVPILFHQGVQGGGLTPGSFTQDIQAVVGGDPVEPGGKGRIALKLREGMVDLDENILSRLLRVRVVGEHGEAVAHYFFMVLADEFAIGLGLAGPDLLNDVKIANGSFLA